MWYYSLSACTRSDSSVCVCVYVWVQYWLYLWHCIKKKKCMQKSLYQSVTTSHRFPNVNVRERKASIPRPGLGAASRSPRRWCWRVWMRRRWGDSFLQLELWPSGNTHGQKKKKMASACTPDSNSSRRPTAKANCQMVHWNELQIFFSY